MNSPFNKDILLAYGIPEENLKQVSLTYASAEEAMKEFCNALKLAWQSMVKGIKDIWLAIKETPTYRRMYYESISAGKSNNWRRMHGLKCLRKPQKNRGNGKAKKY